MHLNMRRRHPLYVGTAALSLLATALPSAAFAQQHHSPFTKRPLFIRGGQSSTSITRNMSGNKEGYTKAPTPSSISPFNRPIKKVTIVGGTHGNEYTGVWCIKVIEKQREIYNEKQQETASEEEEENVFAKYTSFDIDTLLANPVAFMENKRFMDTDLNREFSLEKLQRVPIDEECATNTDEQCDVRNEFCADGNVDSADILSSLPHESIRAREIECLLGPKFTTNGGEDDTIIHNDDPSSCVVVDLHTTTANMGISLIIPEGDVLMSAAAAYVLDKCRKKYGDDIPKCVMHALPKRQDRMNLSSCGRHGFTIEVGPTPQGVLRHECVEKTQTAMNALLEFLHLRNLELENNTDDDSSPLLNQLKETYPGGIVPCYRSAPAIRPGELSGKISWPNDPANPNFPSIMVHKSIQDRDFEPLRVGDPLFVELDGTIVTYDGSHGDEVHLIFVNEGGYYYASSGTGIGVAVKSQFDWESGWFVVESDDEEGATEEVTMEVGDTYE